MIGRVLIDIPLVGAVRLFIDRDVIRLIGFIWKDAFEALMSSKDRSNVVQGPDKRIDVALGGTVLRTDDLDRAL